MSEPVPQRRPVDADLASILELVWEGKSLRAACLQLGLHTPSTSDWLHADEKRREQYTCAREGRAEFLQEDALTVNRAAALSISVSGKKVDASGAKGYLDAVKWATARMAPKTAPVTRVSHSFESLTDAELDAQIADLSGASDEPPADA